MSANDDESSLGSGGVSGAVDDFLTQPMLFDGEEEQDDDGGGKKESEVEVKEQEESDVPSIVLAPGEHAAASASVKRTKLGKTAYKIPPDSKCKKRYSGRIPRYTSHQAVAVRKGEERAKSEIVEQVTSNVAAIRDVSFDEALLEGFECERLIMVRFNPEATGSSAMVNDEVKDWARFHPEEQLFYVPAYKNGNAAVQMFFLHGSAKIKRIEFENCDQIEQLKYGIVGKFSDGSVFWLKK